MSSAAIFARRGLSASRTPPSDTFNLAFIGLGGQGTGLLGQVTRGSVRANVVALCDVNDAKAAGGLKLGLEAFPKAKKYNDYRKLLDEMHKDIDGVVIATNNHQHCRPGMVAMQLRKHLYLEKPLAPTVWEIRQLVEAANKYKVTTQMGNYGHSLAGMRTAREFVQSGKLGPVKEVHVWTQRAASRRIEAPGKQETPSTLQWDRWLGPARWREYAPAWVRSWAAWWDFGGGPLFDIGCHTMDAPVYALDLDAPVSVEAVDHEFISDLQPPRGSILRYEFAARGNRPPVTMFWYDAPSKPPRPPQLREGESLEGIKYAAEGGALFVGEKNTMIVAGMKAFDVQLLPLANPKDAPKVPDGGTIGRAGINHMQLWVDAAKAGKKAGADFATSSGPLAEIVSIGSVVQRMPKGAKLLWDTRKGEFKNMPEANKYLKPYIREGWEWRV